MSWAIRFYLDVCDRVCTGIKDGVATDSDTIGVISHGIELSSWYVSDDDGLGYSVAPSDTPSGSPECISRNTIIKERKKVGVDTCSDSASN